MRPLFRPLARYTLGLFLLIRSLSPAEVIADWDFSEVDLTGLPDNSAIDNPIATADKANTVTGLSSSDLTHNGVTSTTGNPATGEINVKNWDVGNDFTNDNYLEFTLTAAVAGTLDIDSISISLWRNGSGAPDGMAFDVSVDGGEFEPYGEMVLDDVFGDFGFDTFTFTEAITGASSVVIRFTPRRAEGTHGTGNLHIDGLTVDGSAGGGSGGLRVTGIELLADNRIELTWNSRPAATYTIFYSTDGASFDADVADDIPSGGETTTFLVEPETAPVGVAPTLLFRVSEDG